MPRLRGLRFGRRREFRTARCACGRCDNQHRLFQIDCEPGLPLRVRNRLSLIDGLAEGRQLGLDVGISPKERVDAEVRGRRSRHVANEMYDCGARRDVGHQHAERVAALRLEVLLNVHRDVRKSERPAKRLPVNAELTRDAGQEQLNRH